MARYTFQFRSSDALPDEVLHAKTTYVKVSYHPVDMYVNATLEPPSNEHDFWRVVVGQVPNPLAHPNEEAVLHVTRGELGKHLGTVKLGSARGSGFVL